MPGRGRRVGEGTNLPRLQTRRKTELVMETTVQQKEEKNSRNLLNALTL